MSNKVYVANNKVIENGITSYYEYGIKYPVIKIEVSDEIYQAYLEDIRKVIYQDGQVIFNPDYEEIKKQEERQRLDSLFMTRSDFFDGFIMAFGLDPTELRTIVENILNIINITDIEIKIALNNYDNALNFYRKHTLFTLLNNVEIPISEKDTLVFTSDIWDKFFDTKDYKELQKALQKHNTVNLEEQ